MTVIAPAVQPMAELEQQTSAAAQMPSRRTQLPRFNNRSMTCFEDSQIRNIQILRNRSGGSDSSVVRTAVDLLAYLNNLPVETDPSIYLNNWLANNLTPQNGDQNGR